MNEFGKDWRICVGGGSGGDAFTPLGGETGFNMRRSSQEVDLTDKDSGVYGSGSYTKQRITISPSGNLKLPDPAFARLYAASKASPPEIEIQIKKGSIIKFDGMMAVGNFSSEHPATGAVTFSCDLGNVGAPTVDDLIATT